jgi:hypothetical protein
MLFRLKRWWNNMDFIQSGIKLYALSMTITIPVLLYTPKTAAGGALPVDPADLLLTL